MSAAVQTVAGQERSVEGVLRQAQGHHRGRELIRTGFTPNGASMLVRVICRAMSCRRRLAKRGRRAPVDNDIPCERRSQRRKAANMTETTTPAPTGFIDWLCDGIAHACLVIAALSLLCIVAINGANVVARYLFGSPFSWAEELMLFLMILGGVLRCDRGHLAQPSYPHRHPHRPPASHAAARGVGDRDARLDRHPHRS